MQTEVSIPGSLTYLTVRGPSTFPVNGAFYFYQVKPDAVRSRKPKGILPPKSYSFYELVSRSSWMRATMIVPADTLECFGDFETPEYGEGRLLPPSGMKNRVVTKALIKLKDQRINFGVAMAEAQETADMIGSIAGRVARGYKRLAAKDPKGALRALGGVPSKPRYGKPSKHRRADVASTVPNQWLEYQYGINPALSDLNGAWEELQKQEGWSWVTTVRAQEKVELTQSMITTFWDQKVSIDSTAEHRGAVVLSYKPQQYALQSIARLGLSNPLEIVWEKTPFSFMLDWIWPMGECLSTLDATVGYEFLHGSYTQFSRYKSIPRPLDAGVFSRIERFSPGVAKTVVFNREALTSSPRPGIPGLKNPLSLGHMANGLAVLSGVLKSFRK